MGYSDMAGAARLGRKGAFRLTDKWRLPQLHGGNHGNRTGRPRNPQPAVRAERIHMLEPRCAPDFVLGSVPENMRASSTSCAIEKAKLGSILQVTKLETWN